MELETTPLRLHKGLSAKRRDGSKADISECPIDVRFTPESGNPVGQGGVKSRDADLFAKRLGPNLSSWQ
jgi:hypothetical protein